MIFEFGEFAIDTDRFELRRRGEVLHVEPQVFDVLRYLVEHRDRVVPKDELLDNVWGNRFVSESALTSRIKAARQAVGDDGRAQHVIGTVHGRGYRFVADVVARESAALVAAATGRHDIRYARSGSVNIAYEVTGSGPVDIVLVPGFVSHLELDWEDPRSADFLERLGALGRLIRFDKRGTGLSDRPPALPDLEARMDDVRAVMDAVGSTQAVLFGYSEGGPLSVLFAATYPARTRGLVLYGTYARRIWTEDYPWAPKLDERVEHAASVESDWGTASNMRAMCPNADAAMADWWQRRARAAASPGAVRALVEMNSRIDIRSVLPTVRVPTLVLHRTADPCVTIENGRFVASQIPNARLVELPGTDHVPWIDADQILAPVEQFLTETQHVPPAASLPATALATTLFTDIVGSTGLNADIGDARYSALLDRHDRVMREVIDVWQGRYVKSTGDGVLAVFATPTRALHAALEARSRLAPLALQIRASAHVSEIETRADDIAGLGVAIAARLLDLAQPGEILVTDTVRELARGSDIEFVERGEHALRGVPEPWNVHAVVVPELAVVPTADFGVPPRKRATNLPQLADPFLGRDDDLQRVAEAVAQSRLVTLAGPGGVGKTRLALEYARASEHESWFVDLSRVSEGNAVARAFLDTIGVSPRQEVPDCDRLAEALEARSLLFVVDNCEQVVEAVAEVVGRVQQAAPGVRLLATSRQALNVNGEQVLVVAPLELPAEDAPPDEQRNADALRLFLERAERAGATVDDLAAAVALCRRLDGMPLALELAAARLRAFSPAQILEQLDAGWSVSVSRRDHGPAHHLSLDDAIDWSFQLLDGPERDLLVVLSVFRGAFDLAAATAISGCDTITTADRIAQLVDKSLVQSTTTRAGRRFRLLETVRAFTLARLDDETAELARERHCSYFADQVEALGARVPGPEEGEATAHLAVDYADVSAAFAFAAERDDIDRAARLASGPRLLVTTEGARWARLALQAVDLPGIEKRPEYVALLGSAAWSAVLVGDLVRARELAQAGIAIVGDPAEHPRLCWIWPQATGGSFVEGADSCLAGAIAAGKRGDAAARSFLLGTASIYRLAAGDDRVAVEHAREALDLARRIGSQTLQIRAGGALAYALQDIDAAAARRAADEVLAIAPPGDFHLSMPQRVLAILAWRDGDYAAAAEYATQAAYLIRDQGDRYVQATAIRQLAILVGSVHHELGAELLGIADGLVPDARMSARDAAAATRLRTDLLEALGADRFAEIAGRARAYETATSYAVVQRALEHMTMRR